MKYGVPYNGPKAQIVWGGSFLYPLARGGFNLIKYLGVSDVWLKDRGRGYVCLGGLSSRCECVWGCKVCVCSSGQGWLKRRSAQEAEVLRDLFSSSFVELYRYSTQALQYKMDMLEAFIIMQSINMLQGLIPPKVHTHK